jgi:nucleoside-diphosphate-sugar epimerase
VPNPPGMTTVLATGCSGFLGRHCAAALVRHGFKLHGVSRTRQGEATDGITWHKLVLQTGGATEQLIATLRPSHLLHLAWVTAPDRYRHAAENLDWMEASLALVKAFAKHGGRRFVGGVPPETHGADRLRRQQCHAERRTAELFDLSRDLMAARSPQPP